MSGLMENSLTDWIGAFFFGVMAIAFAFSIWMSYQMHKEHGHG